MSNPSEGRKLYELAKRLFPINRSITGDGVRRTLAILQEIYEDLFVHEVPTGTKVFDWTVPREWNVREAYIECPDGSRIADFHENNLHLVGYSVPVDETMPLETLQDHLYSLPERPSAIPYVTSYYKERFGFCLAHREREKLKEGNYRVYVESELKDGSLTYGEIVIPGEIDDEIFISSYICHPSMANDELSGPCIAVYLAKWLADKPRRYTYRIIFIPETIGSITYLSQNLPHLKKHVIAGFNMSCLGDPGHFSYIPSRYGGTLADRAAQTVLKDFDPEYITYSFLQRGSDERQYCAPGVDLPLCCITRTKFGEYPEYHTSADDMKLITPEALGGSLELFKTLVQSLESNRTYRVNCLCEPQLSSRGLYPTTSEHNTIQKVSALMDFITYCDGTNDLFKISGITGTPVSYLAELAEKLVQAGLLSDDDTPSRT